MTNRQHIWSMLVSRLDQWVTRQDIDFVGGTAADRRMREIKENLPAEYALDVRRAANGTYEYRLRQVSLDPEKRNQRYDWQCVQCKSYPRAVEELQPAVDPRYRLGKCACGSTLFRSAKPVEREEVAL